MSMFWLVVDRRLGADRARHDRCSPRRLTNGFSKKVENLAAAVSLYFMHYNFGRVHQSLGKLTTPAMAAGISDHVWTCEESAALLD